MNISHASKTSPQVEKVTDTISDKWKQLMGAAKLTWGQLTDDELLKSEGHEQKLVGLIQQRYAITSDEASKQVKEFLDKHND
jgi:uncharacterized protein YjbJ (UPF0337 family)